MSKLDYQIKNYMEVCVQDSMKVVLRQINACQCEKCSVDIMAIALNSLPAKYIVTEKGQLYSKIETLRQQFDVDIIAAVTKAAVIVSRAPRHSEGEKEIYKDNNDES